MKVYADCLNNCGGLVATEPTADYTKLLCSDCLNKYEWSDGTQGFDDDLPK